MINASVCNNDSRSKLTLEELEWTKITESVAPIVITAFLSLLCIVGTFGNLTTMAIYLTKMPKNTHRVFVVFLAAVDAFASTVTISFAIYQERHPYTFSSPALCKVVRSTIVFSANFSLSLLNAIALERYRGVCRPLGWQVRQSHAKIFSIVSGTFIFLCAVLSSLAYGVVTKETGIPGILGKECTQMKQLSSFVFVKAVFFVILNSLFVVQFLLTMGLYFCVFRTLVRRVKKHSLHAKQEHFGNRLSDKDTNNKLNKEYTDYACSQGFHRLVTKMESFDEQATNAYYRKCKDSDIPDNERRCDGIKNNTGSPGEVSQKTNNPINYSCFKFFNESQASSSSEKRSSCRSKIKHQLRVEYEIQTKEDTNTGNNFGSLRINTPNMRRHRRPRRLTLMFLVVSVISYLVFVPLVVAIIIRSFDSTYFRSIEESIGPVDGVFRCFAYLNHVINPVIYGLVDASFRKEVCKSFRKIFSCRQ